MACISDEELAALRAVVEAVPEYASNEHVMPCRVAYRHCTCGYEDLHAALKALAALSSAEDAGATGAGEQAC